jgi:hypothetical protein
MPKTRKPDGFASRFVNESTCSAQDDKRIEVGGSESSFNDVANCFLHRW